MGASEPPAWVSVLPLVANERHSIVSFGCDEHVLRRGGEDVGGEERGRGEHDVLAELGILGEERGFLLKRINGHFI